MEDTQSELKTDPVLCSELLCSLLCHDLINPVGSLLNGLELYREETQPELQVETLELLQHSAELLSARIQFARFVYGASTSCEDQVDPNYGFGLLSAVCSVSNLFTDMQASAKLYPKPLLRLMLCLGGLGVQSLPRGGLISLKLSKPDSFKGHTLTLHTNETLYLAPALESYITRTAPQSKNASSITEAILQILDSLTRRARVSVQTTVLTPKRSYSFTAVPL